MRTILATAFVGDITLIKDVTYTAALLYVFFNYFIVCLFVCLQSYRISPCIKRVMQVKKIARLASRVR